MSAAAILSIRPIYADQILAGTKTIELRKSSMGLNSGDIILVYSSAPEQRIKFWFNIREIEALDIADMWSRYHGKLGVKYDEYMQYFDGQRSAVGLHVGEVHSLAPIPLKQIQLLIPGFVPPQGLIWLRDDFGKFEPLLASLSAPLPDHIFAQQNFAF